MALIEGMNYTRKERSANFRLIVSGGESPTEAFITDPSLPVVLQYSFGGPGLRSVVIPKGLACAVKGMGVDFETGKKKPILTIADGTLPYIGIAPYNIAQKINDRLVGNQPTVVCRAYIELPYIPNADDCAQVKYGAVFGNLQPGDLVKVAGGVNKGHLTKWEETDGLKAIVGKVWAIEDEQEPWGWFKWVMWDEAAKRADQPVPDWAQNAVPTDSGYPYEPKYRDGTLDMDYYLNQYLTNPKGIPGLTDGTQRAATQWAKAFTVPAGSTAGSQVIVTLDYKNVIPGTVGVTIGGSPVDSTNVVVDYKAGVVTITLPQDYAAATDGNITYKAFFFGTPPGWDYIGAVGVARILIS